MLRDVKDCYCVTRRIIIFTENKIPSYSQEFIRRQFQVLLNKKKIYTVCSREKIQHLYFRKINHRYQIPNSRLALSQDIRINFHVKILLISFFLNADEH